MLIIACAVVVIMIAVGLFFITKIMGGQRELQAATSAGGLNIAKNAIVRPSVKLQPGVEADNFGLLGDPNEKGEVNLVTFNRLVAQSMIVALNAATDAGPGNLGAKHAKQLIDAVEGKGSIGDRLAQQLSMQAGGLLTKDFSDLASVNSTRMIAKDGATQVGGMQTAYVEQRPSDSGATNLRIPQSLTGLVPPSLISKVGTDTYLRGYVTPTNLPFGAVLAGVPLQPTGSPHLISEKDFGEQINKPSSLQSLFLPPNAFRVDSEVDNNIAGAKSKGAACSQVASLARSFDMSLPYGYIAVFNAPNNGPGSAFVRGPFGNINNVLNHELLSPGVFVSGNIFTTDLPLLDEWAAYNKAVANGQKPAKPSMKNLFTLTGENAEEFDAASVKWTPTGESDYLQCVDTNTNGNDPTTVCPKCHDLWQNGAFDNAFANRPTNSPSDPILCTPPCLCRDSGVCRCMLQGAKAPSKCGANGCFCTDGACVKGQAGDLMADEYCKMQLIKLFWKKGDISASGAPVTGLRKFERNKELPWNRSGPLGVVSTEATAAELIDFVSPDTADKILKGTSATDQRSVYGRIRQIKPEATDKELDALLKGKQLKLGERLYIYMKDPIKDRRLMFDVGPPPGMNGSVQVDGNPYPKAFSISYPLVGTFVNPHYDNGISYLMYLEGPDKDDMVGTDTATWKPCTGFNNCLGLLQFTNSTSGDAKGWNKPN